MFWPVVKRRLYIIGIGFPPSLSLFVSLYSLLQPIKNRPDLLDVHSSPMNRSEALAIRGAGRFSLLSGKRI